MTTLDRRTLLASAAALSTSGLAWSGQENRRAAAQPGQTPHTRFAVNVEMWFRDLPFLDRIRAAARLGFPAIEFWPYQGKDISAIKRLTNQLGLEVAQFTAWGFNPGLNDPANHDAFAVQIEEACAVAKELSCKMMTVVGGNDRAGVSQADMHSAIVDGLKRVAPIVEEHDVMLILEPMNIRVDHPGHCLYGSAPAIEICERVNSPLVKINWDLYHMQITEGDLCGRLREGLPQIGYLQLADHPGRNEPGTGEVHYNRVLKEAYDLGYRGYVGLECSPKEGDELAARRVAAADRW